MSTSTRTPFAAIEDAIEDIRAGKMIVVCDDPDRENEGDLCVAAQFVTAQHVAFMAREARGLICLSLPGIRCDALDLPPMVPSRNGDGPAFTVSIEAAFGVTTGISAADRAHTIRVAADPGAAAHHLVRPGHVFPLRARPGGVLERRGQTEAAVDLTRLAGLTPAGVLCEVMNDDGTMASGALLESFCERHRIPLVSVAQLAEYRVRTGDDA
jgi:3,4-dihydroxy 2-butanone 4-phosphate synthase / GTP cyclohydrolase II